MQGADGEALAAQVPAAAPAILLPAARAAGGLAPPIHLLDSAQLADDVVLAVLRDARGLLVAGPLMTREGVRRAVPGEGAAHALAGLLARGCQLRGGLDGGGFDVVLVNPGREPAPDAIERPMLVDQTHESVVVGEQVVVKWAVRAEQTPAPMLTAHLSRAGFSQMPQAWGFVTWSEDGGGPVLVASAMQYLEGASDGWTWAVQDAGEHAAGGGGLDDAVEPMAAVGCLVADLHAAFATPTDRIARPVSSAAAQDVEGWRRLARRRLDDAGHAVDGPEGERLAQRRDAMRSAIDGVTQVAGCLTIPVHGDLHVGQVLRWAGGYAVGDFDGNPVLATAERLRPQPAARDVAGMLQSIDHVGRVVSRRVDGADPERVDQWIGAAQEAFLDAYRERLRENGHAHLLEERLLLPFRVEQECREFLYAAHHLPRWRYVPDQALQALFP